MALPSEIQTSTITGTYLDSQGEPCTGTVTFTPPCRLTSVLENVILSGPITVTLDANGSFAVELPCTDQDQLNPTDFTYTVTERLNCSPMCPRVFSIVVPCSQDEWDIADLTPVDSSPGTIMVQGPPGPTGPPGPQGPVTAVEAGSNIEITGTGTTANPYVISADTGFTSVTACGAVGDGTTNDAPAIQECLDAARDAGGGWVVVPEGNYLLATLPLRIYRNTRLTLINGARFVRGATGTMIINGDAGQNYPVWTGHGNIIIEGGVWDARGTASGLTASALCIAIGHAADVTIRDLEIRDVSGFHAIEMNSTKRGIVQNCRFLGFVDNTGGTRDFTEALQIDLAKGADYFGGFGPHDNTVCEDVLIEGCYFGGSGTTGTTAWPRGIGSHSATIGTWHRRVRIVGCTFQGLLQYAISAYNWEDTTVSACTFMACGSGVRLRSVIESDPNDTIDLDGNQTNASQAMRNFTVTGCTFRSGGDYDDAIVALGEDTGQVYNVAISGNAIYTTTGTERHGVRLQNVYRLTVVGNTITFPSGTAISTEMITHGVISDNAIWGPGAFGITVVSSDHTNVTGNITRSTGSSGIYVDASEYIQVRDNYVKAPSRSANGTYYGIRVGGDSGSIALSGNKTRPYGSGNEAAYGLRIFAGSQFIHRYGNDWRGDTWTTGNMLDESDTASLSTSATDLA